MTTEHPHRSDEPHAQGGGVRLQRFMAAAGVGPRRACERMIEEGRVKVNGRRVTRLPAFVVPGQDRVSVDGRPLSAERARPVYIMVNKPERTLVTSADEPGMGRTTVLDLVDHPAKPRLVAAGRLDYSTTGLVLLTSDGPMVNRLTHPRFGVPKVYRAVVKGALQAPDLLRIRGAMLKDLRRADRAAPRPRPGERGSGLELRVAGREMGRTVLEIELSEGRTGNLAKMLAAAGVAVRKLERTAIGPLRLTGLARASWRELDRHEIRSLRDAARGRPGSREPAPNARADARQRSRQRRPA
ncbi:MAG: pseudouridine synthase [Phycisphaerales bacterium]